jgi:hypothetical protein
MGARGLTSAAASSTLAVAFIESLPISISEDCCSKLNEAAIMNL